jgi:hypothetical protein
MSKTYFRVHPAINFARVGNSSDYYIAPETAAGDLVDPEKQLFGGLPIKKGTEDTPINGSDFRDADQNVVRQAARFRIYAYDQPQTEYPGTDQGTEIKIGDTVGDKTVRDIVWTVHLANKKNNIYQITNAKGEEGVAVYEQANADAIRIRDPEIGKDQGVKPEGRDDAWLSLPERLTKLQIDAGPRTIASSAAASDVVHFNAATTASYALADGTVHEAPDYPVSFPSDHFKMYQEYGAIDTLGELQVEEGTGRLIVTGGYGRASGIMDGDTPPPMDDAIDNNDWFDDTSDGPVNAVIVYEDGSTDEVVGGWVVTTDPAYAPQTRNVVSTWDDMFNTWVEDLELIPGLYKDGAYQSDYKAAFDRDIIPVFHGAFLQRWNTSLPNKGVNGHNYVARITPQDDPKEQIPNFKDLLRDPNKPQEDSEGVKMPLALGDAQKSFLSLTPTQYFLMMQWYDGTSVESEPAIGPGEQLDRGVLLDCLRGRYSPGIDLTFIVRDVNLYVQDWKGAVGPFRINQQPLDYRTAQKDTPFLGAGYIPLESAKVEPGDLCKFMSQPWHSDYNSCAVHEPAPNPTGNNTLYWSWPAQRPVQVHPDFLCTWDKDNKRWVLGGQLFSVRGDGEGPSNGTHTNYPQNEGRYQDYMDFLANWHKVGFIIQGVQIKTSQGGNYGFDKFLEVESLFTGPGDVVQPWPTSAIPKNSD